MTDHSAMSPEELAGPWPATWEEAVLAPAFIVNLDRRPDRLAWTTNRVREAGFRNVRRVRAIDGRDPEMLAQAWEQLGNPPFHPGEPLFTQQPGRQGCFLSMVLLLRWIVDREIPLATIFEDDALFHSRWDELAPAFYAETPRDIDLLYLGGQAEMWLPEDGEHALPRADWLPPIREGGDWPAAPRILRTPTYKLGAFMITLAGARAMLARIEASEGGVYAIDNMFNHAQRAALAGRPGPALRWATWNATAVPDAALVWLPVQTRDEHGLVFQQVELGTDIDERWLNYVEPAVARARELATEQGVDIPAPAGDSVPGINPRIHSIDLLADVPPALVARPHDPGDCQVTLVSTLMLLPESSMDPAWRRAMLRPLFDAAIPLVLYMDAHYRAMLQGVDVPPWVTVRPLELDELDVSRQIAALTPPPELPSRRDPRDSAGFLALMNAKTELVARASREGLVKTPVTGFIDAGIAKLFADWPAAFARLREADFAGLDEALIPGCWPPGQVSPDMLIDKVNWTFAGSLLMAPTRRAGDLHRAATETLQIFLDMGRLTWEVNVWALMRDRQPGLIRWYRADHDESLTMLPPIAPDAPWPAQTYRPDRFPTVDELQDESIGAWAAGDMAAGRLACDRLMNHPDASDLVRAYARRNAVHYASALSGVIRGYRERRIEPLTPGSGCLHTPGLAGFAGAAILLAGCRREDQVDPRGEGAPAAALFLLNKDGEVSGSPALLEGDAVDPGGARIGAFGDDLRPFMLGGMVLASGTWRGGALGEAGLARLGLFGIDLVGRKVAAARWLGEGQVGAPDAGWMPATGGGRLRFLASTAPIEVVECDPDTGGLALVSQVAAPIGATEFHVVTPLRPDEQGWFGLVREQAVWDDGHTTALHRVARFGHGFALWALSHPFRLQGEQDELISGMIPHPGGEIAGGERLLLSASLRAGEIWLVDVPRAEFLALALPIETLAPYGSGAPRSSGDAAPTEHQGPLADGREFGEASGIPTDFRDEAYFGLLDYLHRTWEPDGYLEIGVENGVSLARSGTASVGVDPYPRITSDVVSGKPWLKVFAQESDRFFEEWTRDQVFGNRQLQLAFVDGMHLAEFVLRDIMNVEQWSAPDGLILVHDVIPNSLAAAGRTFNPGDWEGDVWRVIPALQRWRPDLKLHVLSPQETPYTGMLMISSLDPASTVLSDNLDRIIAECLDERVPYAIQLDTFLREVSFTPVPVALAELQRWRDGMRDR